MKTIAAINKIVFIVILSFIPIMFIKGNDYWKRDYTKADAIAAKTKKINNIEKLSKALTADLVETVDKYRAIFTWVALNISYDCVAFKKDDYSHLEPMDVLSMGKSVCQGYAALFEALCEKSGLMCETADGWTKNNYTKIGQEFAPATTHAWNIIYIDKHWYLCDVTWAAGTTEGNCDKFVKGFSGFYFCTPPEIFSLNHYPNDAKWLLGVNITKSEFQNLPHFFNPALENNIRDLKPAIGTIKYKQGSKIEFQFKADLPVKNVIVQLSNSSQPEQLQFTQANDKVSFSYVMKKKAPYLIIYLNTKGTIAYKME
jgi:transglutaminase/protease-like cytokinesis protein 3